MPVAEFRLANGSKGCEGRVEAHHDGQWVALCDEGWGLAEARVLCRQLGCGRALSAPGGARFGQGDGRLWPNRVSCVGTETTLGACKVEPCGNGTCHHGGEAGGEGAGGVGVDARGVEVFHNKQWGRVCDADWDLPDAEVVCRQLDCGRALSAPGGSQFGQGRGFVWMGKTECQGTEDVLANCQAMRWGVSNCSHRRDAGVVCSGSVISSLAPVRLADGPGHCAGRVEVFHKEEWGTVCDNSWDFAAANVVCRQLGCGMAVAAPRQARFGEGRGRIWLDDTHCTGTEAALSECRTKDWGVHLCQHKDDASVVCSGSGISDLGNLRLVNGSGPCSGRVEVFHDQRWGGICTDGWDLAEAHVVCRQLGCGKAQSATGSAPLGTGDGLIWVDAVECSGTEGALFECNVKIWGAGRCKSREHAVVSCSTYT
ncbi:PREDICTED: scavenger receptor cysteine-rich domain-containing group B protein-like, partial [Buceros rhinoceros silvestris]|uniref:scavenger receptor cysteine-rich domain-containing group B protein-like n=1 Tax=Buceros rhinoceros silvestris TaxID=175836 RepID=UPI000528605C